MKRIQEVIKKKAKEYEERRVYVKCQTQHFLMVTVPGFLLSPLRMLLIVACGTADILLNPFGVIPRSLHSSRIRAAIVSQVFIGKSSM